MMKSEVIKQILEVYPDEDKIKVVLEEFENSIKENFVIELLIEKRNNKINQKMIEGNNH